MKKFIALFITTYSLISFAAPTKDSRFECVDTDDNSLYLLVSTQSDEIKLGSTNEFLDASKESEITAYKIISKNGSFGFKTDMVPRDNTQTSLEFNDSLQLFLIDELSEEYEEFECVEISTK